jgi:hypothetical protein
MSQSREDQKTVETLIDPAAGLITYKVTGDLELDDIRKALEGLYQNPDFRPGMNALWEIKNGTISVTATELPELIELLKRLADKRGSGYRAAIVVRRNMDFGLSTVFQMHAYSLPFEIKVFQSLTQAKRWVAGEDP